MPNNYDLTSVPGGPVDTENNPTKQNREQNNEVAMKFPGLESSEGQSRVLK
ncbi:hypothetical protein GJ688_09275 [Heliobacillus mobilis]|uniref:Uncharacterized protein n=1 Tax=Heliobacterium mobile TaxID=28064 RepID=A0A6I3SJS8_HELMO|nr:hypothetical protein [Heliobacterium mobile]MTV49168.1 hypothetical protein [Heliobacterium mobile]